MKFYFSFLLAIYLIFTAYPSQAENPRKYERYVNPFIGATTNTKASRTYHGLGKTFPGAATPFGMVQLSPNTITGGDNGSGYSYEHTTIEGFAFTQMSGVGWYGDLGNFLVMPTTGPLKTFAGTEKEPEDGYRSTYDKSSEKVSAGYYSVFLSDYQIYAEATAAPHSGILCFTFPESDQSRIQIDLARRVGGTSTFQSIEIVNEYTIKGYMKCTPQGGGWGNGEGKADYTVFFYAQFSKPFDTYGIWSANIPDKKSRKLEDIVSAEYREYIKNADIYPKVNSFQGKHLGFYAGYKTHKNEKILLKTGISFTSIENAEKNLKQEIKGWDFSQVHRNAEKLWHENLGKIKIEGGTYDDKVVFYTALYHTLIDPRTCSDINGEYRGADGKIYVSDRFDKRTIFSGWDVFRAQMPLQTIINPRVVNDLLNSLIELADQSGKQYYERWEFLNAYSGCMLGNPAISVLCDAYSKGIRDYDTNKAYQYAVNSSNFFGNQPLGFTPGNSAISHTLEYAYTDWCLSQLAHWMGKIDESKQYEDKSQAYRHVFDKDYGWFRPRNANGKWMDIPENGRLQEAYGCVECNPYQQGWFVPHDIEGMISLMGGKEKVIDDLITMFENTPDDFLWNQFYNHANEPVHHIPFLFNKVGKPSLTQKYTRTICEKAYKNSVMGLVGNEDVGQMSAWYIMAASGIYPVCPGDGKYEITSPVFDKITFTLDKQYADGKSFTIIARNNSSRNVYIQEAKLNGKTLDRSYITHEEIIAGATLELTMGPEPSEWGE